MSIPRACEAVGENDECAEELSISRILSTNTFTVSNVSCGRNECKYRPSKQVYICTFINTNEFLLYASKIS